MSGGPGGMGRSRYTDDMQMRSSCFTILLIVLAMSSGCFGRRPAALNEMCIVNRSEVPVLATLHFGDYGADLRAGLDPGEYAGRHHLWIDRGFPKTATIEMQVWPVGTTDTSKTPWTNHTSKTAVDAVVPKAFTEGAFWFSIQPDLSVTVVAIPQSELDARRKQGDLPR